MKTRKPAKKQTAYQNLMDARIFLPGCPQIVVTRGYAYQWLKDIGYDENERGFGSIDYAVFSQRPTNQPLSDLAFYSDFLEYVKSDCKARNAA